jgi:ankyrin repeat protein
MGNQSSGSIASTSNGILDLIESTPCYRYAERTKDPLGKHVFIHDWYHTLEFLLNKRTLEWKKKEQLMSKEFYGVTCLHSACAKNADRSKHASSDIIKLMIRIGGMELLMVKDDHCDYTPLQMLAYDLNTSIYMMEVLLVEGRKDLIINSGNSFGYTMLHELCMSSSKWEDEEGVLARIRLILQYGEKEVLFATTEKMGRTALHLACMESATVNVIDMLVNKGGKDLVMMRDNDGLTALHFLCMENFEEDISAVLKVVLLLNCAGDELLKETTNEGATAYDFALQDDAPEEVLEALAVPKGKKNFLSPRKRKADQPKVQTKSRTVSPAKRVINTRMCT